MVERAALVIGGGVAGLRAASDLARAGLLVQLVEADPRLGGHAALLSKVFPTLEGGSELVKRLIDEVVNSPRVKVFTHSEVLSVDRRSERFEVHVLKKARYVNERMCTACGKCEEVCPVKVPRDYEMGLAFRKAICLPSPHPFPPKPLIDRRACLYFKDGSCRACEKACPEKAISFDQTDEEEAYEANVIIVATGFKPYDVKRKGQYKYGVYKNVITGMEYERMCDPNGPTDGKIVRVDNGGRPKGVAYVLCVGSRDERACPYCCKIGCTSALKHSYLLKGQYGDEVEAYVCYTDLRAIGRRAEAFYRKVRELGVHFIQGQPSEVRELPDGTLTMDVYDRTTSKLLSLTVDLVVLEAALEPNVDVRRALKVPLDENGFIKEAHPSLLACEASIEGVFLAGAVREPMEVAEAVISASAVSMRAIALLERLWTPDAF